MRRRFGNMFLILLAVYLCTVIGLWSSLGNRQKPPDQPPLPDKQPFLKNPLVQSQKEVVYLECKGLQLSADDLKSIESFNCLITLDLSETNIRDEQLGFLKKIPHLKALILNNTQLTNAAVPFLEAIPHLTLLETKGTGIAAIRIGELENWGPGLFLKRPPNRETRNRVYSVLLPLNRFLLLQSGKLRMALKFTKITDKGEGGAEYVCFWQPAPEGPFDSGSLKSSKGEVFEKYRYENQKDGTRLRFNDGGQVEIPCGPLGLEWSKETTVYLPSEDPFEITPLRAALTNWSETKEIDFQWKELQWCYGTQTVSNDDPAEPFFHEHLVRAPVRRFVLLRRGKDRMALRLSPFKKEGQEGAEYTCYWQTDAQAVFSAPKTLKKSQGEVFEKYREKIRVGGREIGRKRIESKNLIQCGPLLIAWSDPTNLVSLHSGWEMAETTWPQVEEIDFDMKELKWYKPKIDQIEAAQAQQEKINSFFDVWWKLLTWRLFPP